MRPTTFFLFTPQCEETIVAFVTDQEPTKETMVKFYCETAIDRLKYGLGKSWRSTQNKDGSMHSSPSSGSLQDLEGLGDSSSSITSGGDGGTLSRAKSFLSSFHSRGSSCQTFLLSSDDEDDENSIISDGSCSIPLEPFDMNDQHNRLLQDELDDDEDSSAHVSGLFEILADGQNAGGGDEASLVGFLEETPSRRQRKRGSKASVSESLGCEDIEHDSICSLTSWLVEDAEGSNPAASEPTSPRLLKESFAVSRTCASTKKGKTRRHHRNSVKKAHQPVSEAEDTSLQTEEKDEHKVPSDIRQNEPHLPQDHPHSSKPQQSAKANSKTEKKTKRKSRAKSLPCRRGLQSLASSTRETTMKESCCDAKLKRKKHISQDHSKILVVTTMAAQDSSAEFLQLDLAMLVPSR